MYAKPVRYETNVRNCEGTRRSWKSVFTPEGNGGFHSCLFRHISCLKLEEQHGHNECFRHLESFGTAVVGTSVDVAPRKRNDGRWTRKISREELLVGDRSSDAPSVTLNSILPFELLPRKPLFLDTER